jgi:RecJ-like exonuclease
MPRDLIGDYVGLLFSTGDPLAIYDAADFFGWLEAETGERHYDHADTIHALEDQLRDRIRHELAGVCDFCHGSGKVETGEDEHEQCDACEGTGEDVDADPSPLLIVGYADGEHERALCVACGAEYQHAAWGFLVVPHRGPAHRCQGCGKRHPRTAGDLAESLEVRS